MNLDAIKSMVHRLVTTPDQEQEETRQRLDSIIEKLSDKKARLKEQLLELGESDHTSDTYIELDQEYQVVSKLLKKARQNYHQEGLQSLTEQENDA